MSEMSTEEQESDTETIDSNFRENESDLQRDVDSGYETDLNTIVGEESDLEDDFNNNNPFFFRKYFINNKQVENSLNQIQS
ncbi:unnamed protein product [Hymenolepis diminuta]|uniref:Uncharacterized protein n=1 Tax=Hymenolepis diminuta TaxID=6216 RepID=A0A564XX42_HYMDI|nr:unnamed protein product [Hymenolepis diminuta]